MQALDHAGGGIEQGDVRVDLLLDVRAQHLDHHLAATVQRGRVHLRNRGTGHGGALKLHKDLVQRLDAITEGAAFVLGHNVVAFDQPALKMLHPGLALHQLPLVDVRRNFSACE